MVGFERGGRGEYFGGGGVVVARHKWWRRLGFSERIEYWGRDENEMRIRCEMREYIYWVVDRLVDTLYLL